MSATSAPRTRAADARVSDRLLTSLRVLYDEPVAVDTLGRMLALLDSFADGMHRPRAPDGGFSERDVVLITYGDQVREPGKPPLRTLREFLVAHAADAVTGVHLLPFYPATSDDGFAVVEPLEVDPRLGGWSDVVWLGETFRLMVDAVVNHVSTASLWFGKWRTADPGYRDFFIAVDPEGDHSAVTRPRSTPLFTPVDTIEGRRWVWTTFSADQIDLNYANPRVLLAVTEVLLTYVEYGASIIRLDAIGYLWKRLGTPSVHLPETHEVVRLWRTVLDAVAPGTLLITETNVPHRENISYFGNGDNEAHLVYQFPLAPLTLAAFHTGEAGTLSHWASALSTPSPHTAFFNFLASHDGIGLRPAEGLLHPRDISGLVERVKAHGGKVSYKANADGTLSPYELNTTYYDALNAPEGDEPRTLQIDRFLAAHSILLALAGIPAIYIQSLLGSRNWREGVARTGHARSINRQKFSRGQLEEELTDPRSLRHQVFGALCERIRVRASEPALHPRGEQRVVAGNPAVFALLRTAPDGSSRLLCLHNVSARDQVFTTASRPGVDLRGQWRDLLSPSRIEVRANGVLSVGLQPYGVRWLRQPA